MKEATALPEVRRVGRPARIDRQEIADAVLEIGLAQSNMKTVAERLGISVPGLYHHVRNRKELLLLAAERSMAQLQLPNHEGKHWSEWLREWGRYSRQAFVEEPEVFAQYLSGAVSWDQVVEVVDSAVQILTRQGFTPAAARQAWGAVGTCAIGSAALAIRHRASAHPVMDNLGGLEAEFEEELTTVLAGLAVRRGEPWAVVLPGDDEATVTPMGKLATG
ncbi:MAG TPA: hypothetical protein VGL48_17620 [Acidimicrobiales bacterium]|jgi:AcrR family transcriptional regulator